MLLRNIKNFATCYRVIASGTGFCKVADKEKGKIFLRRVGLANVRSKCCQGDLGVLATISQRLNWKLRSLLKFLQRNGLKYLQTCYCCQVRSWQICKVGFSRIVAAQNILDVWV